MRDPVARPASPGFNVSSSVGGGGLVYRSYVSDSTATSGVRVLSGYAEVAPAGSTYKGKRAYPMTSADFSGFGRGHVVDHADGDATTTSSASNYVPESRPFNEGARNHLVQDMRSGGGTYQVTYDYSPTPARTADGTAIPTTEHFMASPTGGTSSYFAIPNTTYPNDRSTSAANPFLQTTSFPAPSYH